MKESYATKLFPKIIHFSPLFYKNLSIISSSGRELLKMKNSKKKLLLNTEYLHYETLSFVRVAQFDNKVGSNPPPPFWALFFEKIAKIVCSRYATISLVPDSEGLKPKRNDDNSCVLRNSINKPHYGGHNGPCIKSWWVSTWGLMDLSPRPHVTDW